MKLIVEVLLSIFLHPIAMVLMWIDVIRREDLGGLEKLVWIIIGIVWGVGPIVYVLVGGGELW